MSDPQQAADAVRQAQEHLSWWQLFLGGSGGLFLARIGLSVVRRLNIFDSRAGAEEKLRRELLAEMEAMRKRATEREVAHEARITAIEKARDERLKELQEALDQAEQANIDAAREIAELQGQLASRGQQVMAKPYRTFKPPKE